MESVSGSNAGQQQATVRDKPTSQNAGGGGVKETIESILIAFILAFVFRAFVVEAFVIPTGSMAPTLLGAHMRFDCADCGYDFSVNYSGPNSGEDPNIPKFAESVRERVYDLRGGAREEIRPKVFNIRCPNCGFRIGEEEYARNQREPGVPPSVVTSPPVHYGDRILVLKYQYLFQEPRRWDVVVFKSPDPPRFRTPEQYDYSVNYIKRLVGKPGETLLILDGDIYTGDDGTTDPDRFTIQHKPYVAQEALWRIVYDNDYHPQRIKRLEGRGWVLPWKQASDGTGWDLEGADAGRTLRFDNPSARGAIYFDRTANPFSTRHGEAAPHAFTDWLAYDVTVNQGYDEKTPANTYDGDVGGGTGAVVTDVKVKFLYQRLHGSGPLRVQLTKLDRTFVAELTPDSARLLMRTGDGPELQVAQPHALGNRDRKAARVEFMNVDYRVSLRINGKEVLATTPREYRPDVRALLQAYATDTPMPPPAVQIEAENQKSLLSHLSLWRDVHYINTPGGGLKHAIPRDFPDQLIHLKKQPAEYFTLGDNSIISGDGRFWRYDVNLPDEDLQVQAGVVPDRFLLGKAFFVYWPAGYRPIARAPGVIPNFGEMRFIH